MFGSIKFSVTHITFDGGIQLPDTELRPTVAYSMTSFPKYFGEFLTRAFLLIEDKATPNLHVHLGTLNVEESFASYFGQKRSAKAKLSTSLHWNAVS